MRLDWLRRDHFANTLKTYGLHRCAMAGQTLCVGLGPDPAYRLTPLQAVPATIASISFLDAPLQADLIRAFATSPRARRIEHLVIGTSHDYAKHRAAGYDMTQAVAALHGASLPMLKRLSLGDMEMLFNGHRLFGSLGEISPIFQTAPALTELHMHGHFTLSSPAHHRHLTKLEVEVDDIGVTGGPLDQQTVSNLLLSDFPALTACALDFGEDAPEGGYQIPAEAAAETCLRLAMQAAQA
jgi:hypothetical protein